MTQGSAQPQRLVYGTTRVSGLIVFQGAGHKKITVTGQSVSARAPGHLFWVLPLAGHACEAFKDLYLDDFELKDTEISWGADPANAAYRQWSALCVADYLTDRELGMGVPTAHIDWDSVVTAATVCDTLVDALGPVQPRKHPGSPHSPRTLYLKRRPPYPRTLIGPTSRGCWRPCWARSP